MEVMERQQLSQEQMGQIFRLAGKKVRLSEIESRGGAGCVSPLIEENVANLEKEIQKFGVDSEFLEILVTECCRTIAAKRVVILLEVRCCKCIHSLDCLLRAPGPLICCTSYESCTGGCSCDEFGRDKTNVFVAEMLIKKFL